MAGTERFISSIESFSLSLRCGNMATLFNTDPRIPRTVTAKVLRAAKRIIDEGVPRQLTPMEIVKAAMAASGVAGSLGTMATYKLTSAITQYQVSKSFDEREDMVRKKLRGETKFNDDTRDEAMRESAGRREVTIDNEGSLVNIPTTTEADPENRLVQVNTGGNRGTKRSRNGDEMDASNAIPMDDGEPEAAMMALGPGGSGNNPQSKETPITPAPSISYGLQETHTTIIPWNFWFSQTHSSGPTSTLPKLSFRLNSIDDIVETALTTVAPAGGYGTGTHNVPYNGQTTRGSGTPALFPRTITNGVSATERPFWSEYWKKIYEYYTVLGCEYKITIHNPTSLSSNNNNNILVITDQDSYSDTAGSTGNRTPDVPLAELLSFPRIKVRAIAGQGITQQNSSHEVYDVIQGRYKPGQINRNISNDGDVKTWTRTDGTLPSLKDLMNIRLSKSPFYLGATGDTAGANYQVEVKYIVQFKDLRLSARYPYTGAPVIQQNLPADALDAV